MNRDTCLGVFFEDRDIESGAGSSAPRAFIALGNRILFSATTAANGIELYRTDGTAAGTAMVADINPGNLNGLTSGGLFFALGGLAALGSLVIGAAREERRQLVLDGILAFGFAAFAFSWWVPTLTFQLEHTGAPWRSGTHIDVVGLGFNIWLESEAGREQIMRDGRFLIAA